MLNKFEQFLKDYEKSNFADTFLRDYTENQFISDLKTMNDELLKQIMNNSTIHSNDFSKIVLAKYNGIKLRFHIWNFKEVNQYHEPHNHRWGFKSYILTGTMVNRIMIEDNNKEKTFLKCKSNPMKIGEKRNYEIIDKVGMSKVEDFIFKSGDIYQMEANTIHIAKIPKNNTTSTLFITKNPSREYSDLYMPNLKEPPINKILEPLELNKFKLLLSNIILLISEL